MRRFVLLVHRVPRDGNFTLNDLAGGAGRMDEVARAVSTAFTVSNDLRRDTQVLLLFGGAPGGTGERRITVSGDRIRYLNPDERSTAALLKNALVRAAEFPRDFESSPGIVVGPAGVRAELERIVREPKAVWLTETGTPWRRWSEASTDLTLLLSDPYDPTEEEHALLVASGIPQVSFGARSLRTSQVIELAHHELDELEGRRGPPA
ncbi:MAG: tRNA (pseudouridine(54)-N(1))-methyltransferase TrmY [Thermoplasmata archaeon]